MMQEGKVYRVKEEAYGTVEDVTFQVDVHGWVWICEGASNARDPLHVFRSLATGKSGDFYEEEIEELENENNSIEPGEVHTKIQG